MSLRLVECDEAAAVALCRELRDPSVAAAFFAASRAPDVPIAPEYWTGRAGESLCARDTRGRLIGAVRIDRGSLAYLVCAAQRSRGYGHALAAAAVAVCANRGIDRLRAHVIRENVASVRILERAGFRFVALDQAQPMRPATLRFELEKNRIQP